MTKLRRGVDEFAGLEEKGHRSITAGDVIGASERKRRVELEYSAVPDQW
jgi:hypothetical protein